MRHVDPGHMRQQRHGEVLRGAVAAGSIGDRRRRGLGQRQQFGQRVRLYLWMYQHELRKGRDQADRGEVLVPVIGQLLVDQRVDRMAHGDDRQRVAVARRLGDDLAGDHTVGAGAVVGDDRLAPGLREVLAHRARQQVGRAARREGDHHADLLVRVGALRPHGDRGERQYAQALQEVGALHCRKYPDGVPFTVVRSRWRILPSS
jgi:hypothetical protein